MSARYIRFHPTKRNKWNCLRVEIYGVSSKPVKSTQVLSFLNYWHSHVLGISHFFNIYIYPWWNFWWTSSESMQSSTAVLGVTEKVHDIGSSSGLGTTRAKTYSFWTQQETGTLNISGGDIHFVRAVARQGEIFRCLQSGTPGWLRWRVTTNQAVTKRVLARDNFTR